MTIGIIEDDRLLNQALNKFLTDNGYDTVCAHSGREVLLRPRIIRICGSLILAFRMETVLIYTGN